MDAECAAHLGRSDDDRPKRKAGLCFVERITFAIDLMPKDLILPGIHPCLIGDSGGARNRESFCDQ